jgi:hypothetical protein
MLARVYIQRMKTNITIEVDTAVLRQIRELAAEEGISIGALVAARLDQIVRERNTYERARKRALARLREGLDLHWIPPRSRDKLHEP